MSRKPFFPLLMYTHTTMHMLATVNISQQNKHSKQLIIQIQPYMHVTTLHHIGLFLLLKAYGYITDNRALRQTKLATLVGAYWHSHDTIRIYVLPVSQFLQGSPLRQTDTPRYSVCNNGPHLRNYTPIRPSNIGCSSAQRIIQNKPMKPALLQISLTTDVTLFI